MSEDLFEDSNLKVYENQELIYQKLKVLNILYMNNFYKDLKAI